MYIIYIFVNYIWYIKILVHAVMYITYMYLWRMSYVDSRFNFHDFGDGFDNLIAHALFCTLESEDVRDMSYGGLRFGSLDKVIKVADLGCLNEGKAWGLGGLEDCSSGRARRAWSSQDEAWRQ